MIDTTPEQYRDAAKRMIQVSEHQDRLSEYNYYRNLARHYNEIADDMEKQENGD
jgi:hypothetical protein